MRNWINRRFYLTGFLVTLFFPVVAQRGLVQTSANRTSILIGEQIRFTVRATAPNSLGSMRWFWFPDSTQHFEMIRREKIDTIHAADLTAFQQTFVITSFDSGKWFIPSFPVDIISAKSKRRLFSDSILIDVRYSPEDSTGQLRDIKPVMDVEVKEEYWYYILAALLLLILIGILLYRYFKRRPKKEEPSEKYSLPPYEEALKELEDLKKSGYSDHNEVKDFHTRLAIIFKRYYERSRKVNMMNKTTGEVVETLRREGITGELFSFSLQSFLLGDAVKFAKYIPPDEENKSSLMHIRELIEALHRKNKI